MEHVGAILATVIGSVVSAVLTHIIIKRIGGGEKPQAGTSTLNVSGDHAKVHQDNRKSDSTVINHVYQRLGEDAHPTPRRHGASDDPWAEIVIAALGAVVLALAYLLVWPFVVGLLFGASLVVVATATATTAGPTGSRKTRWQVRLQALLSVTGAVTTAVWIWLGGPWGASTAALEARVAAAIPAFDGDLGEW